MNITRRIFLKLSALVFASGAVPVASAAEAESATPFTTEFPNLDSLATGKWWLKKPGGKAPPPPMDVPRDQVIAFALYTEDRGVLKLTAQLYPPKPGEPRKARLELQRDGHWIEALKVPVFFPGWSAHFRIGQWHATKDVPYRVRHGEQAVFSQTAFCGAVHLHGEPDNRLLADLDCNGWPQTGRNRALEEIRRARAVHLCGDQHLAVMLKHGISEWGDGPYAFTSPALVNTIYGRWWHPLDEKPGPNPVTGSPLPWTGDFKDGLGNKMSIMAYANPPDINDERQRADGYGLVRFHKKTRQITVECWPRFADVKSGDRAQFPGWPITVAADENDGRKPNPEVARNIALMKQWAKEGRQQTWRFNNANRIPS